LPLPPNVLEPDFIRTLRYQSEFRLLMSKETSKREIHYVAKKSIVCFILLPASAQLVNSALQYLQH
jgi:hypothetical protein